MRTEDDYCKNCNTNTEQLRIGFVPLELVMESDGTEWINANYCLGCDSVIPQQITQKKLNRAEERYLHALVEHDVITKQTARQTLGLE